MPLQATLPLSVVNVPNDYFSMAGFEVTLHGRFWVTPEVATRLRANGVHEYDISDLLGHSRPGVTTVYARATRVVLDQAVEKLTEPWGQVIEFERRAG
jgi:integrase